MTVLATLGARPFYGRLVRLKHKDASRREPDDPNHPATAPMIGATVGRIRFNNLLTYGLSGPLANVTARIETTSEASK